MPLRCHSLTSAVCLFAVCMPAAILLRETAVAQQRTASQTVNAQGIGSIDIAATKEKIGVSGAVTLTGSSTVLGNGSTVTAGKVTLPIHLTRGGTLDLCATTQLHLSQENNTANPNSPLMLALDRGAIEAHYKIGKNSDVILTPDLRILLSGPGEANVQLRVSARGDTCVDNRGADAPYVTVSEQIGAGVYRVQPNQRVLFEHGSVRNVVDNEPEPCGCPPAPAISVASAGKTAKPRERVAKPGEVSAVEKSGGPSSTPADTAFPLAVSEGLAPVPAVSPNSMPGVALSQVTSTLSYVAPRQAVPTGAPHDMATPESAATVATSPAPGFGPSVSDLPVTRAVLPEPAPKPPGKPGFFHKIGHFFAKIFG